MFSDLPKRLTVNVGDDVCEGISILWENAPLNLNPNQARLLSVVPAHEHEQEARKAGIQVPTNNPSRE